MNTIMALAAPAACNANVIGLDTDSRPIGIDNRATRCISNQHEDFVGELVPASITIQGYTGRSTRDLHQGTIRWAWLDDNGMEHAFNIPNCLYDPGGHSLLSPHHWAQSQQKGSAARCITDADKVQLLWENGRYTNTGAPE